MYLETCAYLHNPLCEDTNSYDLLPKYYSYTIPIATPSSYTIPLAGT